MSRIFFSPVISPVLGALILALGSAPNLAKACKVERVGKRYMAVRPETGRMQPYTFWTPQALRDSALGVRVENCEEADGQFLQLNLGLVVPKRNASSSDIILDGKMRDDACRVDGNTFSKELTYEELFDQTRERFKVIQSCFQLQVTEISASPLNITNRTNCAVTMLSASEAILDGPYCYLKVRRRNAFLVSPVLKPECLDPRFLKAKGIARQDLDIVLNFWIAGEDTGLSTDLDSIGKAEYRFTFEEEKESKDNSVLMSPVWSNEVHYGGVRVRKESDGAYFQLSLQVDRRSADQCDLNGVCTRPENFFTPIAAEVTLTEKGRGPVASWYYGAVASPAWQGLLNDELEKWIMPDTVQTGKTYTLSYQFRDPKEDFDLYRSGIAQRLIELKSQFSQVPGIGELTPLGGLEDLAGLGELGRLPGLSGGATGHLEQSLIEALHSLQMLVPQNAFPPYYDKWCDARTGKCAEMARSAANKEIRIEFKLGELPIGSRDFPVEILSVEESDRFGNQKTFSMPSTPTYVCH